jgi:hypothetical protein
VHAFREQDKAFPAFPHNSTLDQLFTDQKFEAYRVLGYYAAHSAMKAMDVAAPDGAPVDGNVRRQEGAQRPSNGGTLRRIAAHLGIASARS